MSRPKRKEFHNSSNISKCLNIELSEMEYEVDYSNDEYDEMIMIPNPDDSGNEHQGSEDEDDISSNDNWLSRMSYEKIYQNYTENQTKLEGDHQYNWVDGEKLYPDDVEDKVLLSDSQKKKIIGSTSVQLFETFFSDEMKNYIIAATKENDYNLSLSDLNTFIGIIIFSSFNKRKSQRDYWSTDPYLSSQVVSSAMSRNKFLDIKSYIKYSKTTDDNPNDKGWRVRTLMNLFQKNIQQFGYFRTALSIDEMMVKSFARTTLKQFIRGKPIRFGLKMWSLCTSDGFVLCFDLYCGKKSEIGDKVLSKCTLDSQVVMNLLKNFLLSTVPRKIISYHLYFDNFFTSFDLILHLKKRGLRSTGTIRENRVKEKNVIDKKATRGTYVVKNDKNSGINYITLMDSKQVSLASTAAGVTPLLPSKRYSSEAHSKIDLQFPNAFHVYNKFMGGVDIHDMHCNNLLPCIRSKKWTWVIFVRLIQAAITNSVVIFNAANIGKKKKGTKEFALSISKYYLDKAITNRKTVHESHRTDRQAKCSSCDVKTFKFCNNCQLYLCKICFPKNH